MTDTNQDPVQDAQLAEAWGAFAHLLAAVDTSLDEAALSSRIVARVTRRARRRQLRIGASVLAVAASLLVLVGVLARAPRGEQEVAVAAPAVALPIDRGVAPVAIEDSSLASQGAAESSAMENNVEISAWDDELAVEAATLADNVQAVEQRWQERPDSIAFLQTQADQLEREMADGAL